MAKDTQPTPSFEHQALEKDIERLSKEVKELRERGIESGREAVKQTLHGQFYAPSSTQSDDSGQASDASSRVLPDYLADAPADVRFHVEKLIDFAWHKGIMAAIKEAKKGDPLTLDAFHDALTDKLHDELKKRGHLK